MLGIKDLYPRGKARLYYKDYENGLPYFNDQDQFYQIVEDIANKFLSLRATQ